MKHAEPWMSSQYCIHRMWCHMPAIPVLRRGGRQGDQKVKVFLSSPRAAWAAVPPSLENLAWCCLDFMLRDRRQGAQEGSWSKSRRCKRVWTQDHLWVREAPCLGTSKEAAGSPDNSDQHPCPWHLWYHVQLWPKGSSLICSRKARHPHTLPAPPARMHTRNNTCPDRPQPTAKLGWKMSLLGPP